MSYRASNSESRDNAHLSIALDGSSALGALDRNWGLDQRAGGKLTPVVLVVEAQPQPREIFEEYPTAEPDAKQSLNY
jgi:hypothetical protein